MRFIGSICLLLSVTRAVLVPGPTGPYAVAMKELPLTDTSRHDPLDPTGKSKSRRLLVSLYLPVDKSRRSCPAVTVPYMTPPVAASYGQQATQVGLPDTLYQPFQMEFCDLKKLSPCGQASNKNKKYPLILFEPGLEESRLIYSAMARSLASHGYVVVSVDHPFEAPAIQYPDGTIIEGIDFDPSDPKVLPKLMKVRTDDITFIINQLENQKVMKPVLADFPGTINYKQLAIWGHSFGGATSANVINVDKRVIGGLDLDGMVTDPVLSNNVAKPFVLVGHEGHDAEDPSWNQFWPRLKGKRMELSIANTQHGAFKDDLMLVSALNLPVAAKEAIAQVLGSIDPHQLDKDLNGILMAYFDLLFHGKKQSLKAIPHNFANVTILRGNI